MWLNIQSLASFKVYFYVSFFAAFTRLEVMSFDELNLTHRAMCILKLETPPVKKQSFCSTAGLSLMDEGYVFIFKTDRFGHLQANLAPVSILDFPSVQVLVLFISAEHRANISSSITL